MIIDIPEEQVYTIEQFATDLALHYKWKDVYVSISSDVYWDIQFVDRNGDTFYMTLDGCVYGDAMCEDELECEYLDYRDDLCICNLVWVIVPESVDPHRVIGIIS